MSSAARRLMQGVTTAGLTPEAQFAALVDEFAAGAGMRGRLADLLHEDHPLYDQRGAAAVVRMRGWVLLTFARVGVADDVLPFVLEELDTGVEPYLVAAAARALRSYAKPAPALTPFVLRAITNIRHRDEPVSFDRYGEYAISSTGTSPVRELLATLAWLGPHARDFLPAVESLRAQRGGLPKKLRGNVGRAVEAILAPQPTTAGGSECCTPPVALANLFSRAFGSRRGCEPVEATTFEDQDGATVTFGQFFRGHPALVVFFYTRCENPLKCSLTVTKLARVQKLLEERGLAEQIRTAAITYDPGFDLPQRLRSYGENRGVRMDASHRLLRAVDGIGPLRAHFRLGVNFVGSLVNRHRVEAYILDAEGRVAASFEHIRWDEHQVADRAIEVLKGKGGDARYETLPRPAARPAHRKTLSPVFGTLASFGLAFFPKCPLCWAGYLSMFGIVGLGRIPYSPWLQPALAIVMVINLASVWFRGRATGRMVGFYLVSAGALAVFVSKAGAGWEKVAAWGFALTLAGSLLSALATRNAGPSRGQIN